MSPVVTDDITTPAAGRDWTRTPAQEELVRTHLDLIRDLYADADPELHRLLADTTVWGTEEAKAEFGLEGNTRVFQWYTAGREMAESDQAPHPGGAPEPDATAGKRGPRVIRGSIAGRWRLWGIGAGKLHWDSINKRLVRQEHINSGGAPQQYP